MPLIAAAAISAVAVGGCYARGPKILLHQHGAKVERQATLRA